MLPFRVVFLVTTTSLLGSFGVTSYVILKLSFLPIFGIFIFIVPFSTTISSFFIVFVISSPLLFTILTLDFTIVTFPSNVSSTVIFLPLLFPVFVMFIVFVVAFSFFSDVFVRSKVVSFITPLTFTVTSFDLASVVLLPFDNALFVVLLSSSLSICSTIYVIVYISLGSIIGIVSPSLLSLLLSLYFHSIPCIMLFILLSVLLVFLLLSTVTVSSIYLAFPLRISVTATSLALYCPLFFTVIVYNSIYISISS